MITNHYHDPITDTTLLSTQQIEIRLRLPASASSVQLHYWNKYKHVRERTESRSMTLWAESGQYRYYRIAVTAKEERIRYLQYAFEFEADGSRRWLNAEGLHDLRPAKGSFSYAYAGDRDGLNAPDWTSSRVWYQIFPERFNNGDPENDPKQTEPWGTAPTRDNYMGGDLRGIRQKLDYLGELGINALYLNPIFAATSNHKYDTVNYMEIDPQFGTAEDLKELVSACHERGIKVVLDLVINHCGYYHPYFQDVIRNGETSAYRDWFYVNRYPVSLSEEGYDSVGYYQWMPKLRTSNPAVQQHIFDIVTFWQRETNIDGWRIDVADEVEISFLRELKSVVKTVNPNAFIIAEIWDDAKRLMLLGGIDSAMNYDLRTILFDYVLDRSIPIDRFHERLVQLAHRYSLTELHHMYNLLGSHDTERIMTRCKDSREDLLLLLALQFVFPGSPAVYYGDELGMTGENDPGCRACMPWDEMDASDVLYRTYKAWIRMKTANPVLQLGDLELSYREQSECYLIRRVLHAEEVSLLINFSDRSVDLAETLRQFQLEGDYRFSHPEPQWESTDRLGARQYMLLQKSHNKG